jgi:3-hydroxyisobutyrate dehydrogenase-like beta-hydroxyacid dehydrogenase
MDVATTPKSSVGFLGAGRIGAPMVRMLVHAGYPVTFFARRQSVIDGLQESGASAADRVEDLAAADIVISCLYDDTQLGEVGPALVSRMKAGAIFVSHTTGKPSTLRHIAALASARGVFVLDAGFSGTAEMVMAGQLTVMVGGDVPGTEPAIEAIRSYAATVVRTGELGSGMKIKVLNNLLFAGICQLTLSAIQAGRAMGLDERIVLEVLAASSGGSTAVNYIMARDSAAVFAERVAPFLQKDVAYARVVAAETQADISTLRAAASAGPLAIDLER